MQATPPPFCGGQELRACRQRQVLNKKLTTREVEEMHKRGNWVELSRSDNIETSLLHAKTQSTSARIEVYSNWPVGE